VSGAIQSSCVPPLPTSTVLTIAGFDPSSGAGVTADLAVFQAHGLNGTSAITALTVQSTAGVRSTHPVSPAVLRDTLECLEADLPPGGIKIGMLGSADAVSVVADYLALARAARPGLVVVLDPVVRSSSGRELLDPDGLALLKGRLLSHVDWVTPNLQELAILSGRPVSGREDVALAARTLQALHSDIGVFATGGHLNPPDDYLLPPAPTGREGIWLGGSRIQTRATHGTGCALSSAFLCGLVPGLSASDAAAAAKRYVAGAMEHAVETGSGPCAMDHFWQLRQS
jgi:hydroxymethylpyrimidine/phosphomethylpyrimidine kinase